MEAYMKISLKATIQKKASDEDLVGFLEDTKMQIESGEDQEYTFKTLIDRLNNSKLKTHPMNKKFKQALKDLEDSGEINFDFNETKAISELIEAAKKL
jgi:hypothetical protein